MPRAVRYPLILACICLYGLPSCTSHTKRSDNNPNRFLDSSFFGKKFAAGDSLLFMHAVDSAFQVGPDQTGQGQVDRYEAFMLFSYHISRDYGKALVYSDSVLALMEKKGTTDNRYLDAVFKRGDIYVALTRYDEAFTWYYRARQMSLQQKDTCKYSDYTSRLGMVSFRQRRYKEAVDFYKQSIEELMSCSDAPFKRFSSIQGNYDNIGIMYSRMGWLDSADLYYNKALNYIDRHEKSFPDQQHFMPMARAVIYGNQADVAIQRGKQDEAKELLQKAIAINIDPSRAPEDAAYSMIKLGGIYISDHQPDSVAPLLKKIENIRNDFPNAELYSRYLRLRALYESTKGNSSDAYRFLEKQMVLYDSVFLKKESDPSINVGSSLEQIGRQYQLENANKQKSNYLIIAAVFIAMVFVIKILLLINYRRGRKSIRELNLLNKDISGKNTDLLQTLEKLELLRRDKRQLMHVVAHDLRSPVGSITTLAKMVRSDQVEKEAVPEVLDMIIKAGTSAQALINELLEERAKENEGRQEIIELSELLQYSVSLLQYRATEKQQLIKFQMAPMSLLADREKLLRIFHNLLDNAIKFSPHGAFIRVEMERFRDKIQVRIIDQGIGIPENMRSTLLNEVSSFTRKGTLGEVSFGLGLSIVSQLMRETGGTIWYTSGEGEGTSFYLEFIAVS